MSANLLETVTAAALRSASAREQTTDRRTLEERAQERLPAGVAFRRSLASPGIRIIAECKRRSPSRGILRQAYNPVAIAKSYESGGAAAISVLTEPTFFDGSLDHLASVREAVETPLLRKDFIVGDYQVLEAAAYGAAAVLLIVAALDDLALSSLMRFADSLGLASLVEVHDAEELARAVGAGASIVGVNSRNLRTLEVSGATLDVLGPTIPAGVIAVAESGLKTAEDLRRLKGLRYDAFLIGERFMTEPEPGEALARLIREAEAPPGVSAS
jgi:indole-3-glycerol phosphate synthase